jgi:hypothetical protein
MICGDGLIGLLIHLHARRAASGNGCRNDSANSSSLRTGRAVATTSAPRLSCALRPTDTRFLWPICKRGKRDALRKAQLLFHPSYHTSREPHSARPGHGSAPFRSDHDGFGIHCLCKSQSGQDQPGIGRQRFRQHINGELLKVATRVNMTHVPYRGNAPAVTDLLGGQVQVVPSITAEGFLPQARLRRRTRPVSSHRNLADEPG